MGWYKHHEEHLDFPSTAACTARRATSPLHLKNEVDVFGLASENDCDHEMFVTMPCENTGLAFPLSQLMPISNSDAGTRRISQAIPNVRPAVCPARLTASMATACSNPYLGADIAIGAPCSFGPN